ncbi:MAG: hypothetical protein U9N14_07770, partial [Pseudomonadota bacterium]|nr:hypothetical protein [Pseudomonadota bacterium]
MLRVLKSFIAFMAVSAAAFVGAALGLILAVQPAVLLLPLGAWLADAAFWLIPAAGAGALMSLTIAGFAAHFQGRVLKNQNRAIADLTDGLEHVLTGKTVHLGSDPTGLARPLATLLTRVGDNEETLKISRSATRRAESSRAQILRCLFENLRDPLAGLARTAERLEDSNPTAQQSALLHSIREGAESMGAVIENLVDVARVESGTLNLSKEAIVPADILDMVVADLEPGACEKGVRLRPFFDPAIPAQIVADPARLRQVLYALGSHAVQVTPVGGSVTILAEMLERVENFARLRFAISDGGDGALDAVEARLFGT